MALERLKARTGETAQETLDAIPNLVHGVVGGTIRATAEAVATTLSTAEKEVLPHALDMLVQPVKRGFLALRDLATLRPFKAGGQIIQGVGGFAKSGAKLAMGLATSTGYGVITSIEGVEQFAGGAITENLYNAHYTTDLGGGLNNIGDAPPEGGPLIGGSST